MRKFHCCASCVHFEVHKDPDLKKVKTRCKRLQFDTKPHYQFNCWEPKPQVKKLIEKTMSRPLKGDRLNGI